MNQRYENPFDSIESAHDFVRVLAETVAEAKQEIELDFQRELDSKSSRRREALRIAVYNLDKLQIHMNSSQRILNDLRSLRRLLFAERKSQRVRPLPEQAAAPNVSANETPAIIAAIPMPASPSRVSMQSSRVRDDVRAIPA